MNPERRFEDEAGQQSFKALKVILPSDATMLGLKTEAPVFVSPDVDCSGLCSNCGVEYKPLVYAQGYLVRPHHYHEHAGSSGIYSYDPNDPKSNYNQFFRTLGWVAELEITGAFCKDNISRFIRSEEVRVKGIKAYCNMDFFSECCGLGELEEGVIAEIPGHDYPAGQLRPFCSLENYSHLSPIYRFKVTEGTVLFSQI